MDGSAAGRRPFKLLLIKPSHYDDDGYVIQWLRSPIPANSLACLYGIAEAARANQALGPGVELVIEAFDETNTRIEPEKLARLIPAPDAGVVMLVGVQSNQFPRALDLARRFRRLGLNVGIGGFHVSGTLAMLEGVHPSVQEALDMGCFIFAGEAEEGRFEQVVRDALSGQLKPVYNFMDDLPSLDQAPTPLLPASVVKRTFGAISSFDAGRGCPYQCSFCTIINVQGRKSRRRSADDIEKIVRDNAAQGIVKYFLTDDNFARNKDWEIIFDRLIQLREVEGFNIRLTIQVDTLCHKLPGFIDKARRAGVRRVFIGLENISPDNLMAAKKRQNKITEYRRMLLEWKRARIMTYCGYITGFPNDTPERVLRDVHTVQRELPVDLLEFFFLTPLPGSEDHQTLTREGAWMDPDLNKYDLNHAVARHPAMSIEAWEALYRQCWETYYSREHMARVMRRNAAMGNSIGKALFLLGWFKGALTVEKIHPLECGLVRRKYRRDRRPGRPIEPAWSFYPRYWLETALKQLRWIGIYAPFFFTYHAIKRDPMRLQFMDEALTPVTDHETDREMFQTDEAHAYVVEQRRMDQVRAGAAG